MGVYSSKEYWSTVELTLSEVANMRRANDRQARAINLGDTKNSLVDFLNNNIVSKVFNLIFFKSKIAQYVIEAAEIMLDLATSATNGVYKLIDGGELALDELQQFMEDWNYEKVQVKLFFLEFEMTNGRRVRYAEGNQSGGNLGRSILVLRGYRNGKWYDLQ
jgi:hypothetical protein